MVTGQTGRRRECVERVEDGGTLTGGRTGPKGRRASRGRRREGAIGLALAVALLAGCGSAGIPSPDAKRSTPAPRPAPVWDTSPDSVAAVGDSITRGFDACGVLADCPAVSWATGTDSAVRSLASRLLDERDGSGERDGSDESDESEDDEQDGSDGRGETERSWNLARSGARVADLPDQMTRAASHQPALVAVMVGANDACRDSPAQMTPVDDFRTSFETAMRRLRKDAPKAQVYVSSVPDLKRLWSTGRGNPLGRQIWKLGLCASMLGDAQDDSARARARRETVYERVVAYNGVLRDVCAKDARCRYDGGAVFEFRFTGTQLSRWDWFHPSKSGQRSLAEIAYRNVVAAKPPQ
ncbi:SGNH/GDSL hydrolase family protein [Streptomyces sp. NPDC088725]|uniref:SGNH/GDSL hydrolase family protein n=1 Tax=Streptomyces sp. NPDC088725 TaxID=3365873 RepID=UPI00380D29D0